MRKSSKAKDEDDVENNNFFLALNQSVEGEDLFAENHRQ